MDQRIHSIQVLKFKVSGEAGWFPAHKVTRFMASAKVPDLQTVNLGLQGSRALQGSKVAMSRGKVPSLHHDHKDAGAEDWPSWRQWGITG